MKHMQRWAGLLSLAATAACAQTPPNAGASELPLSIALVGDLPYNSTQLPQFDALVDHINADRSVRLVLHVGDVKGGSERCDDTLLQQRQAQIQRVQAAVVYTPGDNDWTDCHRTNNGSYLPTERLSFLRKLFFPQPGLSGGQKPIRVETQSKQSGYADFVEHQLFVRSNVVFAALHVVGSSNNLAPWTGYDASDSTTAPRADRIAEVEARRAATLAWIDRAFDEAASRQAAGVVLFWQANPGIDKLAGDPLRTGFEEVLAKVKERSLAFAKPVLLLHGDNHELIFDQPLARDAEPAPKVPKFQRVQGIGSPRLHWVKIEVNPRSPALFSVTPQWVPGNP